jgi:uncharacterized protein YlxW (UPF0749 family)
VVQSSSLTAKNLQKQVQKVQATIKDIRRSGKNTLKNIGDELGKKEYISVDKFPSQQDQAFPKL